MIGSDRRRTKARQQSQDVKSDTMGENSQLTEHVRHRRGRQEAVVSDSSSAHSDSSSNLEDSYSKTYKLSENDLGYHLEEIPSRKLKLSQEEPFYMGHSEDVHSTKEDVVDSDLGKYSTKVNKVPSGVMRLAHRHGNRLSTSNTNLEKSGLDPRVYIPAGRVSSRQSAFEEKVNSSSSPSRPTLTRSNSKPLTADSVKFRRNLEAWGERSELQHKSQKCESIADLRTVDLSRQNRSGSQSFVDAKLSSAKSSATLNRTVNLKADVGGLVSRWESRQTFTEDDKISSLKTPSGVVVTSHSLSIPIVTRPVSEIRQRIQPKSTPAPQRTVLGKPGFSDVRKQWESQSSDLDVKLMRSRSKSPLRTSRSRSSSEISKKMVSRSQGSEDVTSTAKTGVANSVEDYNIGQLKRSKSSECEKDKISRTNKCDSDVPVQSDIGNVKCDSDISIPSDAGNAKCDSDSGNISVDSDLVSISTDSEVVSNPVENEFVNNNIDSEFVVDRTENEFVIDKTEDDFETSKVEKESPMIGKTENDVRPVGVDFNVVNKSVDSGFVNMSSDVESFDNKCDHNDTEVSRNNDSMNKRRKNIAEREKIERGQQIHQENHVSTKESVGKKINRKFGYGSYDDDKVNSVADQKEAFVDNVSDRKSRSTIKPMNLEIETSEKESVGKKINRAFGRKFRERYESSELDNEMWNVDVESEDSVELRNKASNRHDSDADSKESMGKESVGKAVNTTVNDKPHSEFENKEMDNKNLHRDYFEEPKPGGEKGKINPDRKMGNAVSRRDRGYDKADREIGNAVSSRDRGNDKADREIGNAVSRRDRGNNKADREIGKGEVIMEERNENSNSDAETKNRLPAVVENSKASKDLVRENNDIFVAERRKEVESDSADFGADRKLANVGAESKVVEFKCNTDNVHLNDSYNGGGVKHRFEEKLGRKNVVMEENSRHARNGRDSTTIPPVMAQLNKSVHSTEKKRDTILQKLEDNDDDAKTSNRKVIQKIGFKDIRNRWEDKSLRETAPSVKQQAQGDESAVRMRADMKNSKTIKSAPPVKPKPRGRECSSADSAEHEPMNSHEPSTPTASCHEDQLQSDQSERHPETSSSSSDESGCEDHDEVFAQSLEEDKSVSNKSVDISSKEKKNKSSPAVTCTTVHAKVIKIEPDSPAGAKTEKGKPLSRSNSGTWSAKKCVTYTAKVTYTQKVVNHRDNKGQRSQDTSASSLKKFSRQSSETSASKTEKNVQDSMANNSVENSEKSKARNRTTVGSSPSNQRGSPARHGGPPARHGGPLVKSVDTTSPTDRGMKLRLPKSPSLSGSRHSRSNILSPTSPTASRSKHTKGCAPELVKTRQNLRSTKSSSEDGSKQVEHNPSSEKTERTRKERNVPSVFERLHSNLPARKSLSVRDLREKEPSNVKLQKSPSRSSLRGSFRSSKSKRLSEDGVSGKRLSSGSQADEKLSSSQVDVRSALNKSADISLDIPSDENVMNVLSNSVENSVDPASERLRDTTENSLNSQLGENISDESRCGEVSNDTHYDVNHCDEKVTSEKLGRNTDSPVAKSAASSRRSRRPFHESVNQENAITNQTEPSENENEVHIRRARGRISSKDTDLPNSTQQQDETPVVRERRSRRIMETGGRSRSTNGSIASTSSSTDLPRGSRSTEGGKQNQGYQQKIVNIDFASEQSSLPQNGSDQASKVAESSPAKPKVREVPPEFIIKPRRQLGDEGETARFKASFDGSPEPELSWEFKGKALANGSKYKIYKKDDFHFLEVQSLVMEDAGKYTCFIRNSAGEASMAANLEVFENPKSTKSKSSPPVFETELKDVVAKEGDRNVCLECRVKAAHDCEVKWYCDGELLKSGRDFRLGFDGSWAKLHFYDLKADFGGCYECVVKNAGGAAKSSATLTVEAALPKSFPPKFTQQLRSQTLEDGQRLIFHAIVTGSPQPSIKWFRNSREITATEDVMISFDGANAKLQIEDVLPEDSADFMCLAQNEAGEARTKATLTVMANESAAPSEVRKEAPRFLRELKNIEVKDGERVEMVVEVEGTPPIDVVWVRNNKEIPANSPDFVQTSKGNVHRLVIEEVFPEDSGTYSCEIYNDFGDTDSQCKLTVQDAGEAHSAPEFIVKPKTVQTEEGCPVTFSCQVKGNPTPTVEWEINGKAVVPGRRVRVSQQGEDHRLDIPHSICGDSGRYTCVVSNSEGTITHTASLNVTPTASTDSQEQTDFRSVLKSRPGLASIGSQDSTESIQSVQSEKSDKGEVEQHDFRKVLTRPVETKRRPKFKTLLQDQKTKEGGEVTLECEVKGVPPATISWSVGGRPIKESKYFRMSYEDNIAHLLIAEAYPEDEGEYTCTAENVAGSASCSCDLYVEEAASDSDGKLNTTKSSDQVEAPKIIEFEPVNISIKKGKTVKIRSRFSGEPAPKIMWFHNKSSLKADNRVKIETRRDVSTVTVTDILPSDGGKYILVIENIAGSQDAVASVNVEDVPNPPAGKPHVSSVTKTSIILTWYGPAYDGGSQITNYRVEMCKCKDQMWKTLTSTCKNTSYQAINLTPDTEYQFRISAGNKHGLSDAGQVSEPVVTTENYEPKSEPESEDELPFEPRDVKVRTDTLFEDEYELKEELGKGKFGNVHRCIEKNSNLCWAAKIIKCRDKEKPTIRQEIQVMNSLRHPKLLMLWDAFESPKTMVLVMEYIAGGELFERIIDDDFMLTERDCVHFMRQICDGVCYMHDHNILHLDLKPENILCISPSSNQIKIIDFGLARPYHPGESTKVMLGTPEFIAPEVINYDEIGFTTDMWSLGVVCYVLLSGLSPFLGDSDPETLVNVTLGEFDFDDDSFNDISDDAKNFIERLVLKNKEKRMTVHQCLKHKWLAQDVKRLRLKRLNTRNLKQFMARRKWQVDQMQENFRKLREDHADDSDSEIETKRRTLTSAHSKDSGIDTYKDKDSYSSMTDLSAGGGALEFLQQMEDMEVVSGDVVLFKVCVTGRPEPTITWFKGKSEITPSRRCIMDSTDGGEHTLKIKDVTPEDAGEYKCSAVNATSQVMCAANMTVVSI
ncbi:titin-like isoform X2 [Liolophura sinensis]|uniref:titin-like isoform X2 n=1 Tax=Liolophura sinensis TaxID=3198878 RepID=UPI003158F28C